MSDLRYQVDVSVATRFLAEQSQPEHNRFAFAYTITVSNNGSLPARLLSRHWVITDGDGHVEHVRGEGVRSEEHTSELQSLMRISYAVFCLKKQKNNTISYTNELT